MDKITITEVGRAELNIIAAATDPMDKENSSRLPLIYRPPQNIKENNCIESKSLTKKNLNRFNVQSLRSLLKDDTLTEINKVKEQTEHRAYRFIKQELLRDMRGDKFLSTKAEEIAHRIMNDSEKHRGAKNLPIEIGKGRNYLSKIVKDFETKKEEEVKMKSFIREKLKTEEVL